MYSVLNDVPLPSKGRSDEETNNDTIITVQMLNGFAVLLHRGVFLLTPASSSQQAGQEQVWAQLADFSP